MASHFTVIAGREGRLVYILQRERLGSAGQRGNTLFRAKPGCPQPSGRTGGAGPPQSSPGGPLSPAARHPLLSQTNCFSFSHNNPPPSS